MECDCEKLAQHLPRVTTSAKRRRDELVEVEVKEIVDVWIAQFTDAAVSRAQGGFTTVEYESDAFIEVLRESDLYRIVGAKQSDDLLILRLHQRLYSYGFIDQNEEDDSEIEGQEMEQQARVSVHIRYGRCSINAQWSDKRNAQIGPHERIRTRSEQKSHLPGPKKLKLTCKKCHHEDLACVALAPCGHLLCEICAESLQPDRYPSGIGRSRHCPTCRSKVFAVQPLYY